MVELVIPFRKALGECTIGVLGSGIYSTGMMDIDYLHCCKVTNIIALPHPCPVKYECTECARYPRAPFVSASG